MLLPGHVLEGLMYDPYDAPKRLDAADMETKSIKEAQIFCVDPNILDSWHKLTKGTLPSSRAKLLKVCRAPFSKIWLYSDVTEYFDECSKQSGVNIDKSISNFGILLIAPKPDLIFFRAFYLIPSLKNKVYPADMRNGNFIGRYPVAGLINSGGYTMDEMYPYVKEILKDPKTDLIEFIMNEETIEQFLYEEIDNSDTNTQLLESVLFDSSEREFHRQNSGLLAVCKDDFQRKAGPKDFVTECLTIRAIKDCVLGFLLAMNTFKNEKQITKESASQKVEFKKGTKEISYHVVRLNTEQQKRLDARAQIVRERAATRAHARRGTWKICGYGPKCSVYRGLYPPDRMKTNIQFLDDGTHKHWTSECQVGNEQDGKVVKQYDLR